MDMSQQGFQDSFGKFRDDEKTTCTILFSSKTILFKCQTTHSQSFWIPFESGQTPLFSLRDQSTSYSLMIFPASNNFHCVDGFSQPHLIPKLGKSPIETPEIASKSHENEGILQLDDRLWLWPCHFAAGGFAVAESGSWAHGIYYLMGYVWTNIWRNCDFMVIEKIMVYQWTKKWFNGICPLFIVLSNSRRVYYVTSTHLPLKKCSNAFKCGLIYHR